MPIVESSLSKKSSDSGIFLQELAIQRALYAEEKAEETAEENMETIEELIQATDVADFEIDTPSIKPLPIEYVYQRSLLTHYQSYHYVQVMDTMKSAIRMQDIINIPAHRKEYLSAMGSLLNGVIAQYNTNNNDSDIIKTADKTQKKLHDIHKALDITPFRGHLKPFECQLVCVAFHPELNLNAEAEVLCHVVGGATETFTVFGKTSALSYKIDEVYIDFGRQVSYLQLSNKK